MWIFRGLFASLATLLILFLSMVSPAIADQEIAAGKLLFSTNCSGCHLGGKNVIMPDKSLQKSALVKYGVDSQEAIVNQITKGKGAMPAFAGKLSQEQILQVASYVLDSAEKGWK